METPIISIVIPCYNASVYIGETLECLQKQTISNWECVIVNDGSTDNSLGILRKYETIDSRYYVIDKENEGVAVARNTAIAASHGKYILPLDADDIIAPSYAEKAIKYLEQHPKTKLVYCKAEFFGSKTGEWLLPKYSYANLLWENSIFCSVVFRRSDFDKTSGYNPNMKYHNEDWDFLLSMLEEKDEVYCIPEILFYYRQHGITRNHSCNETLVYSNLQMMLNHPELYQKNLNQAVSWVNPMTDYYKTKLEKVLNSKDYKLGKFLLTPLKWAKHMIFAR